MQPTELVESLKEWTAVTETLIELVPAATPQELLEYAKGVIASPVAAAVLCTAINGLNPSQDVAPAPKRPVFGARR
jgi:hypothetical protein